MPGTIVYIDDDSDDLHFFELALEKAGPGYLLKSYRNPDQFLESLSQLNPSDTFVFLDVNMPVKNGFQVLKEIRQKFPVKKLPVIMLSTSDNENTVSVSREFGASAYAVKPNDISNLIDLIRTLLNKNWQEVHADTDSFVYS